MTFFVYMLASRRNGTPYIGMTDDLSRRVEQHRAKAVPGFTRKYDVTRLVWFEGHESREEAFIGERRMKKWKRQWKIDLIERSNPQWLDRSSEIPF